MEMLIPQKASPDNVDETMVASCEERRDFWTMLNAIAGSSVDVAQESTDEAAKQEIRKQVVSQIARGLMKLAGDDAASLDTLTDLAGSDDTQAADTSTNSNGTGQSTQSLSPWIDSSECTACDECINLNSKIFAYNDANKAVIKDPKGGPYHDLVKAAEKCTAQVIHPGLPLDPNEKDIDKWLARGEKFN